jgi:phenylpropionate dioxygenase-like ring-hydroxylating dioxygenase large terminal subunit
MRTSMTEETDLAIFSDNPKLRNYWHAVATDVEVTNGVLGRKLLGENLVLYKDSSGGVVVAPDRCPHREAPLSAGTVKDGALVCCYHGWSFGEGGKCVSIPSADPDFPIPKNGHLPCYQAEIRYGLVWVCLGDPVAEIPSIPQDADEKFRRINNPVAAWRVSATRMTDNFLDIAHFPWVHTGTFGNSQRTQVAKISLSDLPDGYHGYEYSVVAENPPSAGISSGQDTSDVSREMSTGFSLPFAVRSTIEYNTGLQHIILLLTTPIDDVNSYFTFVIWRNDDFSVASEDTVVFDRMIGEEDRVMLEKIPGVLPFEHGSLANSQSDKPSTAWRLKLSQLLSDQ